MKKFLATMSLAVALIIVGNSQVNATDVYVGNRANGDSVYLMTDSIEKEATSYSNIWKTYFYDCHMKFKSVDSKKG